MRVTIQRGGERHHLELKALDPDKLGSGRLRITGPYRVVAMGDQAPKSEQENSGRGGRPNRLRLRRLLGGIGSVLDLGGTPDPTLRARASAALSKSVDQALAQDGAAIVADLNRMIRRTQPGPPRR